MTYTDLTVITTSLTGDGLVAPVDAVVETRKGTVRTVHEIVATGAASGTFTLTYGGQTTMAMTKTFYQTPANPVVPGQTALDSANELKTRLEALSTIGRVETTCVDTVGNTVRTWRITYETNAGTLPTLVANNIDIAPGSATVAAASITAGTSSTVTGMYTVEFDGQKTGYLPYDISAIKLKSAMEGLTSVGTVDVVRSDVDENNGYTWTITFLTEMGNRRNMVVDYKALLGTAPTAQVTNVIQGIAPRFNQGADGLPLGSTTVTDLTSLQHTINGLRQGVSYYVRVSAMNAIGRSEYSSSSPTGLKPTVLPPTAPTDVGLTVIDGETLRVAFSSPLRNGGSEIDQYRVEWHTEALVDEIQVVRVLAPVQKHVQVVTSSATDQNEVQVIRLVGTGAGADVTEIQSVLCSANQGSFRLLFGGRQSAPIGYDSTTTQVRAALLNGLGATVLTDVTVTDPNGQTTICHADTPKAFLIEFVSTPMFTGDVPLMVSDVTLLGGRKIVTIAQSRAGNAMISGTFTLAYEGESTIDISAVATDVQVRDALLGLNGIETGAVTVGRSAVANAAGGFAYSVTFTAQSVGGNVPSLVSFGSNLRGNAAAVHVCAGDSSVTPCAGDSSDGNAIRGTFRLELLQHFTAPIPYDASGTTMKSSLEALPNIGTVEVGRGVPTPEDGYTWTITFTANPGSMPAGSGTVANLIPQFAGTLSGNGAAVAVASTTTGSIPLGGTFRLTYDDTGANPKQTDLIRSDAPADAVKSALELLPNMGRVSVTRLVDTDGFTWKVTFNGCKTIGLESERNICNYGNIRQLVGDNSGLVGGNPGPSVVVDTILNGTTGTAQTVSDLTSGPPHTYDIEHLITGQRYYVRVSARNQCPYVCPGCCAYGARQVPPNLFSIPTDQTPGTPFPPVLIHSTDVNPITQTPSITVGWSHPTENGGSPVTGYRLYMDDGAGGDYFMVFDGTGNEYTKQFNTDTKISTMVTNDKYRFKVQSINAIGASSMSKEARFLSRAVRSPLPPSPPLRDSRTTVNTPPARATESSATFRAGDAQVVIRWDPPLDNGGSPVTGYNILVNDGQSNSWTDDRVSGTLERQRISFDTASAFRLIYDEETTVLINPGVALGNDIERALNVLTKIHAATVIVAGNGDAVVTIYVQGAAHKLRLDGVSGTVTREVKGAGAPEIIAIDTSCTGTCTVAGTFKLRLRRGDEFSSTEIETAAIQVTASAADLETILETAFSGDFHVAMHTSLDSTKTNARRWTIAFGDGHPGDIEIVHVDSSTMTGTSTVFVAELAPGSLRHTESNVIEGRGKMFFFVFSWFFFLLLFFLLTYFTFFLFHSAYRFKLAAKNIAGRSAPSAARTVLAANLPFATTAPSITDVSGSKISLVWDAPNANFVHESGSPITGYKVYAFPGAGLVTATNPAPISEEIQTVEIFVDAQTSEVQTLTITGATSGTFMLSWRNEATTALTFNPTAQEIEDALNALTTIGQVDVVLVSGSIFDITFNTDLGNVEMIESFTAATLLPSGGTATVTVVEKTRGSAPLGYDEAPADFTLSFRGEQTPHLSWNISARDMEYSLENLATIGDVTVAAGIPTNAASKAWTIRFHTEVGDIPMMSSTSGRLSRPGKFGYVSNNNALCKVVQTVSGSAALLAWDGSSAPSIRAFDFVDNIVPDGKNTLKEKRGTRWRCSFG